MGRSIFWPCPASSTAVLQFTRRASFMGLFNCNSAYSEFFLPRLGSRILYRAAQMEISKCALFACLLSFDSWKRSTIEEPDSSILERFLRDKRRIIWLQNRRQIAIQSSPLFYFLGRLLLVEGWRSDKNGREDGSNCHWNFQIVSKEIPITE